MDATLYYDYPWTLNLIRLVGWWTNCPSAGDGGPPGADLRPRQDAYLLCCVATDLKISEIVDQPNWIVSAYLPMAIFR